MAKRVQLTTELIDLLCDALDIPLPLEDAARFVGIGPRTLKRWLDAAEDEDCEDELLLELSRRVAAVMGGPNSKRGELMSLTFAMAAADPKVALALMSKLTPSLNETKNIKMDATVTPKAPRLDLSKLSAEELAQLEAAESIKQRLLTEG
jgi:hypothetical protein